MYESSSLWTIWLLWGWPPVIPSVVLLYELNYLQTYSLKLCLDFALLCFAFLHLSIFFIPAACYSADCLLDICSDCCRKDKQTKRKPCWIKETSVTTFSFTFHQMWVPQGHWCMRHEKWRGLFFSIVNLWRGIFEEFVEPFLLFLLIYLRVCEPFFFHFLPAV